MKAMACSIGLMLLVQPSFANPQAIRFVDGREMALPTEANHFKFVSFEKIHLNSQAARHFKKRLSHSSNPIQWLSQSHPKQRQLAMNGVPVLDQGAHGACVMFAVSAALDAINGGDDRISELCALELGSYLHEKNSAYPSGWDGSFAANVLQLFQQYGAIDKDDQYRNGCGGLVSYPVADPNQFGTPMNEVDYRARSYFLSRGLHYQTLISIYDAVSDAFDADNKLQAMKAVLDSGDRVVIGFVLDPMQGMGGATGTHLRTNDTWIMNSDLKHAIDQACNESACHLDAHEVVVTGYDDAVSVGGNKGLLTLRNSWGEQVGHHGEFYMSYDYFKMLVMEATRIE